MGGPVFDISNSHRYEDSQAAANLRQLAEIQSLMAMQNCYPTPIMNNDELRSAAFSKPGSITTYKPSNKLEVKTETKGSCMNSFRAYLDKHRDLIFTVALVFITDHYLLGGALKSRIQKVLEGILNRAEAIVHKEIT